MPFGLERSRDLVTLAFESTEVRYLTTRSGAVDKWGARPVAGGLYVEGAITNAAEMGQLLDDLFQQEGLDRRRVVTAVSGLRAIPRMLTLPKLQASLLEETISREARKEMPVSVDSLYLAWQSLPAQGEAQRFYLLGVPREPIDSQMRALQAAGIKPLAMDLKPLALIRAAQQRDAILVNLEQGSMDIVLVAEHLPAIMRSFSLERESADPLARLERLMSELQQTVRFYNDSHPNAAISNNMPIQLTGQSLAAPEAAAHLRTLDERPTELPPAPLPAPDDLPVAAYLTNLGLALKKV